jgi:hypothetical protein
VKQPNLELKTPAGFVAPRRHEVESFFRFQSQPTFYHKATEDWRKGKTRYHQPPCLKKFNLAGWLLWLRGSRFGSADECKTIMGSNPSPFKTWYPYAEVTRIELSLSNSIPWWFTASLFSYFHAGKHQMNGTGQCFKPFTAVIYDCWKIGCIGPLLQC